MYFFITKFSFFKKELSEMFADDFLIVNYACCFYFKS